MSNRRSRLWCISDKEIQHILDTSDTMSDVCIKLGIKPGNGSVRTLYRRLDAGEFDYSKLKENRSAFKRRNSNTALTHGEVFKLDSNIPRKTVRKILIRDKIVPYVCAECGSLPIWNEKILSLQVEHKNGINTDHRLENLCFLCPNCHSQTSTYGSKNNKGR